MEKELCKFAKLIAEELPDHVTEKLPWPQTITWLKEHDLTKIPDDYYLMLY